MSTRSVTLPAVNRLLVIGPSRGIIPIGVDVSAVDGFTDTTSKATAPVAWGRAARSGNAMSAKDTDTASPATSRVIEGTVYDGLTTRESSVGSRHLVES